MSKLTKDFLEAALIGFEAQKRAIDVRIAELRVKLAASPGKAQGPPKIGRELSAEVRQRIMGPTKKRWVTRRAGAFASKSPHPAKKAAKKGGTSGTGPRIDNKEEAE